MPGTTYYYRAVASGAGRTVAGMSGSFVTEAAPVTAVTSNPMGTNDNLPELTATASDVGGPGLASVQFEYSYNGGA
jgi:hypothetical protein